MCKFFPVAQKATQTFKSAVSFIFNLTPREQTTIPQSLLLPFQLKDFYALSSLPLYPFSSLFHLSVITNLFYTLSWMSLHELHLGSNLQLSNKEPQDLSAVLPVP